MTFEQWLMDGKRNNFIDLYESMKQEQKQEQNQKDQGSAKALSRYLGKKLLPGVK